MSENEDLYELLGVSPTASSAEIAAAYASIVPASAADPQRLLKLSGAFQILADPGRRAEYDFGRSESDASPASSTAASGGSPLPSGESGSAPPGPAPTELVDENSSTIVRAGIDAGRTQLVRPAGEVTQQPSTVACPVCGTPNLAGMPDSSEYCQDCGFGLSQSPGAGAPEQAQGVRLASADGTREFTLREGCSVVGRQDAEVLLVDSTVSRKHAELHLSSGTLEVVDCNSTNGTKVRGSRLEAGSRARLVNGDAVQFGQVVLTVSGLSDADLPVSSAAPAAAEPAESGQSVTEVARLVAMAGGEIYPIRQFPAVVGRRAEADVVIADPYVSGRHAEICEEDGHLVVRDLGSTNGSALEQEVLVPGSAVALTSGAVVSFGKQRFRFELTSTAGAETATEDAVSEPAQSEGAAAGEPAAPNSSDSFVEHPRETEQASASEPAVQI